MKGRLAGIWFMCLLLSMVGIRAVSASFLLDESDMQRLDGGCACAEGMQCNGSYAVGCIEHWDAQGNLTCPGTGDYCEFGDMWFDKCATRYAEPGDYCADNFVAYGCGHYYVNAPCWKEGDACVHGNGTPSGYKDSWIVDWQHSVQCIGPG